MYSYNYLYHCEIPCFPCRCAGRIVNNKTSYGVAKEKEAAAREYEVHQQAGQNAGLVQSRYAVCKDICTYNRKFSREYTLGLLLFTGTNFSGF